MDGQRRFGGLSRRAMLAAAAAAALAGGAIGGVLLLGGSDPAEPQPQAATIPPKPPESTPDGGGEGRDRAGEESSESDESRPDGSRDAEPRRRRPSQPDQLANARDQCPESLSRSQCIELARAYLDQTSRSRRVPRDHCPLPNPSACKSLEGQEGESRPVEPRECPEGLDPALCEEIARQLEPG